MDESTPTPTPRSTPSISRRNVVRAGAHAAWAVPVVTVVAAAPAFAAVSPPKTVAFSGTPARTGNTLSFTGCKLTNNNAAATSITVQVTVTGTQNLVVLAQNSFANSTTTDATGFNSPPTTSAINTPSRGRRFTYTATSSLAAGGVLDFTPTITLVGTTGLGGLPADGSGTYSIVVTAAPGTGSTTNGNI